MALKYTIAQHISLIKLWIKNGFDYADQKAEFEEPFPDAVAPGRQNLWITDSFEELVPPIAIAGPSNSRYCIFVQHF